MNRYAAALALAAAAPVAAFAQEEKPSLDDRFFKAFYQENGLRDFEKAAALYAETADAARAAKDPATELKALLGRGRCLRTSGKTAEAKAAFEAALALDASNEEAKKALATTDTPAGIDQALRDRIEALVHALSGPQKDQAKQDLLRIGARAVPVLEEGLRELDIGVVAASAEVLAMINAPGARGALARAINDPKVTFPKMVGQAIGVMNTGNYDTDLEGRLLILREILRSRDQGLRSQALGTLVSKGFAPGQEAAVAAVVSEALATADDAGRKHLLWTGWSAETMPLLFPAIRPLLASTDPVVRAKAIDWFQYAPKEMDGEDAAAVRAAIDRGTPAEQLSAFRILDGRGLMDEPGRGTVLSGLLACDEAAVVSGALSWLYVQSGQPVRWAASFVPGYLAGFRKALAGAYGEETLKQFAGFLPTAGPSLPDDDLVDLVARCEGKPRTTGYQWTETYASQAAWTRATRLTDPEAVSAAFLRGYRRLAGQARYQWYSNGWNNFSQRFTVEVWQTMAGDSTSASNRQVAYNEILRRGGINPVPATDAMLEAVAKDLLQGNFQKQPLQLAHTYPSPLLAESVRALIARTDSLSEVANLLGLLVKCVGRDAAPDIRVWLVKSRGSGGGLHGRILELLAGCLGNDAVPDVREALRETGDSDSRRLLVRLAGVDAVPDLLEWAERSGRAQEAVCTTRVVTTGETSVFGWGPAVPEEIMEAFVEKLPSEKRTGPLLEGALGSLTAGLRSRVVLESFESTDPEMLTQAARAVRRFNMVDLWPRVVPLLDHSGESVRTEARETLDAIRKYRELKATFERFGEGGAGKAFEDAVALSKSGEAARRRAAALALGALGDPAGVAPLLKLVEDQDASVREAALGALERLGGKR